jgi:tryptophanyl-tRNA synthetase
MSMPVTSSRARVVSGMRPTGRLHLGHLVGALSNWEKLQAQYDCFYFVADWHALTSDFADTSQLTTFAYDNVADWIGAGLDPERSTFFIQSLVPEHAELLLLLSMVVPVPWLERVPTYKEQQEALKDKDLSATRSCKRRTSRCTTPASFRSGTTRWRTSSSAGKSSAGSTTTSARSSSSHSRS